jgi:phage shock protein E
VAQYDVNSPRVRIQWDEFKKLYDAKKIVVVDVRDEQSFKERHIPGAMLVPLDQVEKRAAELRKLGKPVVTYCA